MKTLIRPRPAYALGIEPAGFHFREGIEFRRIGFDVQKRSAIQHIDIGDFQPRASYRQEPHA